MKKKLQKYPGKEGTVPKDSWWVFKREEEDISVAAQHWSLETSTGRKDREMAGPFRFSAVTGISLVAVILWEGPIHSNLQGFLRETLLELRNLLTRHR